MKIGTSSHDLERCRRERQHSGGGIESECIRNGLVVSPSLSRFGHSNFAGHRLLFRKINRLREGLILKRVVKRHLLGARIRENAAKTRGEDVVRARESMAQRVFAERASRGDERAAGGYGGLPLRRVHKG